MAQLWARQFYNSTAWTTTRDAYRASRHFTCERCGASGDEVHHKIKLTPSNIRDPWVALCWDNLVLLCHACHMAAHGTPIAPDGAKFDENGDLVQI
jgi:5-methylcytosine-specific restriction endonuclease McrA